MTGLSKIKTAILKTVNHLRIALNIDLLSMVVIEKFVQFWISHMFSDFKQFLIPDFHPFCEGLYTDPFLSQPTSCKKWPTPTVSRSVLASTFVRLEPGLSPFELYHCERENARRKS